MQPTQQKQQSQAAQPVNRLWDVSGMGLPRVFIKAYTKEQARNEYRIRFHLHESRPVSVAEYKDGGDR